MKLFLPITICFFPLIGLSQEAVTDTIALPTLATTDVPKEVDLERVMSKIWELDREDQQGTFHLMEYQPMYIMPMRFTDIPTEQPRSLNTERPIPEHRDYQHVEVKFQLSLKAKILQDAFGKGDVWVAFTQ